MTTEELDLATWPIFYRMSRRGLMVDFARFDALKLDVVAQMAEQLVIAEIEAGREINPSSGDDVARWLVEEGLVTKQTKGKTRMATDERSLSQLPQHPVIDAVLEYRGLRKLLGTFIEPTVEMAKRDPVPHTSDVGLLAGVVHPKWRLTKVKSGRVATEDPNLLAFPSRTELGKKVRSCFVARPGYKMVSVDFSQLEPRIVAALSGDPGLLGIFAEDQDLYSQIAARLGVNRTVAKILTLGILYGMEPNRLYEQLLMAGCTVGDPPIPVYGVEDCESLIRAWFFSYPKVKELVNATCAKARMCGGWAYTVGGRGRLLPGLFLTGNRWPSSKLREESERQAFNHLVQGSGMEQLRLAMLRTSVMDEVHMLLVIHDEILLEVPEGDAERHAESVAMQVATTFNGVELKVSYKVGGDWGEVK